MDNLNLKAKREKELTAAWHKICDWTKENCAEQFVGGLRLKCPHDPYSWTALVINEQGDARIYHGSHGSDNPEYVATRDNIYGASNGRFQYDVRTINGNNLTEKEIADRATNYRPNFRADVFEEIVLGWTSFKGRIMSEIEKNATITNFEA